MFLVTAFRMSPGRLTHLDRGMVEARVLILVHVAGVSRWQLDGDGKHQHQHKRQKFYRRDFHSCSYCSSRLSIGVITIRDSASSSAWTTGNP
jgi:hypothetical protein